LALLSPKAEGNPVILRKRATGRDRACFVISISVAICERLRPIFFVAFLMSYN
jgi:hypothetical protein